MRKTVFGISPFLVQILAITLNFNSLLQGSAATAMNTAVSLFYFVFWVYYIQALRRYDAHRRLIISLVFWGFVLLASLLTLAVNIFAFDFPALVPVIILFLAPTYGVRIVQLPNIAALTIIVLIALAYTIACMKGTAQRRSQG